MLGRGQGNQEASAPQKGTGETQGCLLAPRPGVFYSGFLSVRASGCLKAAMASVW